MSKITIEKKNENVTYIQKETTVEFAVNGKQLRVYFHEGSEDLQGEVYDIDDEDNTQLTDEEKEIFADEDLFELGRMKDGEKLLVDGWEN